VKAECRVVTYSNIVGCHEFCLILEILAGADLHTTSLKKVRSELETVFGVDLTARAAEG